ncbi:MAG: hypothetical protein K0R67_582, partial [Paenibacillus sp.]|nr:hypothetical protein [Paenibacillus sp.]
GIVGGIGGGWIMDTWGKASLYNAGAGFCLAGALLLYATQIYWKRKTIEPIA